MNHKEKLGRDSRFKSCLLAIVLIFRITHTQHLHKSMVEQVYYIEKTNAHNC